MLPDIAIALIVAGMSAYAVLAGADFGAGFWDLTAGGAERGGPVTGDGPALDGPGVGGQPRVADLRPGHPLDRLPGRVRVRDVDALRAAVHRRLGDHLPRHGVRPSRGGGDDRGGDGCSGALFALSSVLVPFCLGACVGAIAAGEVPVGNASGDPISSWLNPLGITVGVHLRPHRAPISPPSTWPPTPSAASCADLQRAFRVRALGAGIAAGLVAAVGLLVLRSDARELYDDLDPGAGLACIARLGGGRDRHARARVARALRRGALQRRARRRRGHRRLGARPVAVPAARRADDRRGGGAGRDARRDARQRRASVRWSSSRRCTGSTR